MIDNDHSLLRWAGSKRQLLSTLARHWPGGQTRYVEPFAGSACLFFSLNPYRALLSDINSELIATYVQIKSNPSDITAYLSIYPATKEHYYALRAIDPSKLAPSERAARFIYLNRYCFNGLYRTNMAGQFNVPFGGGRSGSIPTHDQLAQCSAQLKSAQLLAGDFENTLTQVRRGDFVYMDPPYSIRGTRIFKEYDPTIFNGRDLRRLRIWLEYFQSENIPFLVSYAQCDDAEMLGRGFKIERVSVRRNIAGFTGSRGRADEILISNSAS